MKSIYMVRHGQTDWNHNGIVQGRTDIELNNKGVLEANDTAQILKKFNFDIIVTSPLKRASKTANIIFENNSANEMVEDELIIERCFGSYEGRHFQELVDANNPEEDLSYETDNIMHERINECVNKYLSNNNTICFVAHSHILKEAIMFYEKEKYENARSFHLPNCAIVKFNFTDDNKYVNMEFIECEVKLFEKKTY